MLSVICPIYNEEKYIGQCIESILQQDYPKDDLEIIFVDGMSNDRTKEIICAYVPEYPFIKVLDNPGRTAPKAMNIGISKAKGDIIIRLDAHAKYSKNYISELAEALNLHKADNVGAPCRTDVLNKTPKTIAIREALSHPFGVGNSVFRIGVDSVKEVDTVPFGCWRREAFEKFGKYDERLTRNQDFELNHRIKKMGGKIVIIPTTHSTYYARESFKALWKQNYNNGIWGILTNMFTGCNSLAVRHYIPMLFVLSLIVPAITALFWWPAILVTLLSLFAYLIVSIYFSIKEYNRKRVNSLYLITAFAVLHLSNGLGMLVSIFTASSYVKKVNQSCKGTK